MSTQIVIAIVVAIGVIGFMAGQQRAIGLIDDGTAMHSRPHYHGWWVFLLATLPAALFLVISLITAAFYVDSAARSALPAQSEQSAIASRGLALSMIGGLADGARKLNVEIPVDETYEGMRERLGSQGVALASDGQDYMLPIAHQMNQQRDVAQWISSVGAIIVALIGGAIAFMRIKRRTRARNRVEQVALSALIGASGLAILTTVGIVFSMLFQTISFFKSVPLTNFFFGTVWDPRFAAAGSEATAGQFGLIPLLAGTLYIAFVAMLFAVPIGLYAAIYMSEYASPRLRSVIKPTLEILAGIPTIVYGIFALTTVGPLLRDISAAIAGGASFIQAQSVLTAGLVMGIMLIPFVSSLSDDVINAVPQSMRDGSLALGATQSETMRKVIMPAALPGIVGALLLTASRAIGETMIVVLAAGVAANLSANPFEAMTTITVKIVNQLTGDLEFNSPQTLVAFALGMTLFVATLGMNVFALYVVRKYREQYE